MAIQVGRTAVKVTVAGGNLFRLAAEHYGDHTQWVRIARANGLRDPFLVGLHTLTIPPKRKTSTSA